MSGRDLLDRRGGVQRRGGGALPFLFAPSQTTAPVITGSLATGGVLTCDGGVWAGGMSRPASKAFQWYNAGVSLGAGAVSSTYTVVATDSGDAITCVVTATNPIGATASDASNGITITLPELWLRTPPVGALGASVGLMTNDGIVAGTFTAAGSTRPVIAQINGINVLDFDGIDDALDSAMVLSDIVDGTQEHGFAIVQPDVIDTDDANYYVDDQIICDVAGNWGVALCSTGPAIIRWRYRGGVAGIPTAIATGAPVIVEWTCDGTTTTIRVGAAAAASGAQNNTTAFTGTLRLGMSYSGGKHFDGLIGELMVKKAIFSAGDVTDIRTYLAGRWGVAA